MESKPANKFTPLKSLYYEWEVEMNEIKRIRFADSVDATYSDAYGVEIPMIFEEKYYGVNDTFMVDESHQMFIVVGEPIRKADNYWEYAVRLMDSDSSARVQIEACQKGMTTRWIGNVKPELHETGNVKYTSNYEKMRGWIGELRCDITCSDRYLALEDNFINVSKETDNGNRSNYLFKMPGVKKLLFDNFMEARNNSMIWQKSTMDENGRCLVQDRENRDLIAGDGIIPQINRYASKYNYSKISMNVLTEAMSAMALKADSPTGNTWAFVVNMRLYNDMQKELATFMRQNHVEQQYLYSNYEKKGIKVGSTYSAYEYGGNILVFHVDNALTQEYPNKGYGILTDLTTDKANGQAAIQAFTLKDRAFTENTIDGVGTKSGAVATAVAGAHYVVSGYVGVGVMCPYRSYILMQN